MTVLHVVRGGDPAGAPLLALHGVTGHAGRWERATRQAWSHRDVLAVDLRGHGTSTWEPPWSVEPSVEDLLDTLDHLDIGTTDVVGHSYGGALGVHLLARAPERVRRLALLDPGFDRPRAVMAAEAAGFLADDGWSTYDEAAAARSAGWLLAAPEHRDQAGALRTATPAAPTLLPDVIAELDAHLVHGADGRFRFRFARAAAITILGELCRPVPAVASPRPTLLVAAASAGVVTAAVTDRLRAELGSDLDEATIDSGHMVLWDAFEETTALVERFLAADSTVPVAVGSPTSLTEADPRA